MCNQHSNKNQKSTHYGSILEHGEAHTKDHEKWNRRQFLSQGGITALGSLLLRKVPVAAIMPNAFTTALNNANSDNILVLIRLFGGNDGLNMIIPHSDDVGAEEYKGFRPTLKRTLAAGHFDTNQLLNNQFNHTIGSISNNEFAVPTEMNPIMDLWNNNKMSIVHNVGYPEANLSHFLSNDYWSSGTNKATDGIYSSGWMGRFSDLKLPCFSIKPPRVPPAIVIGSRSDLTFISPEGNNTALTLSNVQEFNDLLANGSPYPNHSIPSVCANDIERRYLRQVANNAFTYNDAIQQAYDTTNNISGYPTGNELADKLAIVANLIKGGLGTRIYMVTLGGFDTHVGQLEVHSELQQELAEAVKIFYDDLAASGHQEKTLMMAYSEFGRTVKENGSGTDHGSLGPVMLFGDGVSGGFHGTPMNLSDSRLNNGTRVLFEEQPATDFRSIYASILQDWLCVHPEVINCMFGGKDLAHLPNLISNPCAASTFSFENAALIGHNRDPENPDIIQIKYALKQNCDVKIRIVNSDGIIVKSWPKYSQERGSYTIDFNWQMYMIPPGEYVCRMHYGNGATSTTVKERALILQ